MSILLNLLNKPLQLVKLLELSTVFHKMESPQLCECLNEPLTLELSNGNHFFHFNNAAVWPYPYTHYVLLVSGLSSIRKFEVFQNISHQIRRDLHYAMVGMMNVNAIFIMTFFVQDIPDPIIEINKKLMNIISRICLIFSTKLNVTKGQIQKKLALAPVYSLLLLWVFGFIIFYLKDELSSSSIRELVGIFSAYSIGILLVYFIVTYIFIYGAQLLLIKYNLLNLWFILGSAIVLTLFFSSLISLVSIFDLGIRRFNLGVVAFIGFFALPFALMYWYLLFRQHRKNKFANLQ